MKASSVAAVACSLSLVSPVLAQAPDALNYPTRAVRILVPFSPGGGIDILARTTGDRLADKWKVAVVVENRTGASGNIGTQAAASSAPDGYTLLMTANTITMTPTLFPNVPLDPVRDFAPITKMAVGSLALVVTPGMPAKNFAALVALARAAPGTINYSSPGIGTPHHLAMELLKQKAGIDLQHVPYKGSGGALADLISGQVSTGFMPIHQILPQAQGGQLRLLASGGSQRAQVTPDTPSLAEASGLQDVDVDMWYGVYAPAGTAGEVVERLRRDMSEVLQRPDVRSILQKQGLTVETGSPAELSELTRRDFERWRSLITSARVRPE